MIKINLLLYIMFLLWVAIFQHYSFSPRYRINYKSLSNGFGGPGPWNKNKENIHEWVRHLNQEYRGELHHWVEVLPSGSFIKRLK